MRVLLDLRSRTHLRCERVRHVCALYTHEVDNRPSEAASTLRVQNRVEHRGHYYLVPNGNVTASILSCLGRNWGPLSLSVYQTDEM